MERVVLRHLSGAKGQQVESIPLDKAGDLLIGRDLAAHVKFDPEHDDLVGRQHARILQDPGDRYKFSIVDLNSRNGTYVNKQRVVGTSVLVPGDVVQLGPGGPEFQFDLDPLPAHLVKSTRLAAVPVGGDAKATRQASAPGGTTALAPGAKAGVGKETVERMVTTARTEGRRNLIVGVAATLLLAAGITGAVAWRAESRADAAERHAADERAKDLRERPLTPQQIAEANTASTVLIEFKWKLVNGGTGEQIYHEYYQPTDKQGQPLKDKDGNQAAPMPVFWQIGNDVLPGLTRQRGAFEQNQPIAAGSAGSGFAVTTDGFILTNRHVAASWESAYTSFPQQGAALLITPGQKEPAVLDVRQLPLHWIPATGGVFESSMKVDRRVDIYKGFEGQNIYLDVTFALNKLRFPATVARVSDRHDAALIKINTPQPIKKVELHDNYDTIAVGAPVTIMGYPGVSPNVYVSTNSVDAMSTERQTITVPDPTVTPTNIGRIFRGRMQPTGGTIYDYRSSMGDTYQLSSNETGGGNSGGPVFDERGRVIGIFTYGRQQDVMLLFCIPIRFGMELMGTQPVLSRTTN